MTSSAVKVTRAARLRQWMSAYGTTGAMALVVSGVALWSVNCDTVAEIGFQTRRFDSVVSAGVANTNACMMDDGRVKLRFAVLSQKKEVIRPGEQLETVKVSDATFNASNITLSNGKLYPTTYKELVRCASPCEDDRDCDEQLGGLCVEGFCLGSSEDDPNAACTPAGLDLCRPYDEGMDDLGNRFQLTGSTEVSFCRLACDGDADCQGGSCVDDGGGQRYCSISTRGEFCESNTECPSGFNCEAIEGDAAGRKFCTLDTSLQVSGALTFTGPQASGATEQPIALALVMDNSGSLFGRGLIEDDRTVRSARATDPTAFRIAAATTFMNNLRRESFAANTVVSAWSFRGDTDLGVKPLTGDIAAAVPNPYSARFGQTNPDSPEQTALKALNRAGEEGRSPVFESLRVVAQNMVDLGITRRETYIVLFTDGPDDTAIISEGADEGERELARQQWNRRLEEAVEAINAAGAKVFIVHLDAALSADGLAVVAPDARNAVPYGRDSFGRTGPIDEYARLACETGGHYTYVTSAGSLITVFDELVDIIGGTWEIEVGVESLGQAAVENGPLRLGMDLSVRLDGRTDSYSHNPYGGNSGGQLDEKDTRTVVFRREGQEPDRLIGSGGAGGGGGESK